MLSSTRCCPRWSRVSSPSRRLRGVSDFPSLPNQKARASFGTRFVAWFIDFMAVIVTERILLALLGAVGFVLAIFAGLAYFTYFEGSSSGQTIGKRAMSIR